jgi:hypothetical protein
MRKHSCYHRDSSLPIWTKSADTVSKQFRDSFADYSYSDGSPAFSLNSPYIHIEQCHIPWACVFSGGHKENTLMLQEKKHQPNKRAVEHSNNQDPLKDTAISV